MDTLTIFFLILLLFMLLLSAFALWWFSSMLLPILVKGGPFVPSSRSRVKLMLELADLQPMDNIADLGSGDGRILIAAAKAGAKHATGFEIHPGLAQTSRFLAKRKKLSDKITVHCKSFWKADLKSFNVLFLYQLPHTMTKLSKKMLDELPKDARVISNGFTLPGWELIKQDREVYLYKKKKQG